MFSGKPYGFKFYTSGYIRSVNFQLTQKDVDRSIHTAFVSERTQNNIRDEFWLQWTQQNFSPAKKEAIGSTGGIDLTPANSVLKTQNEGEGIKFNLDPAMLEHLRNAPGFVPENIRITPLKSLSEFLGIQTAN